MFLAASAEETVARLVSVGLFDVAVSISLMFQLSLNPVFEELTGR